MPRTCAPLSPLSRRRRARATCWLGCARGRPRRPPRSACGRRRRACRRTAARSAWCWQALRALRPPPR
eukprot:12288786-Alexandrium_andersonii.AAC.1